MGSLYIKNGPHSVLLRLNETPCTKYSLQYLVYNDIYVNCYCDSPHNHSFTTGSRVASLLMHPIVQALGLFAVVRLCPALCSPMDCSTPAFPVLHHLLKLAQTYIHSVSDAIQPSHPQLSPSPPAFNLSQHHNLF